MICVHFKDAEILKGKPSLTIKHWTSCIQPNKLIMSFWRGIGTILQEFDCVDFEMSGYWE